MIAFFHELNDDLYKLYFHHFEFAINFHGGALCACYPLDAHPDRLNKPSLTKDDAFFKKICRVYAENHPTMTKNYDRGIINGAEWYHCDNTMQDWIYLTLGVKNITLEVSKIKNPFIYKDKSKLEDKFWNDNKKSLLECMRFFI